MLNKYQQSFSESSEASDIDEYDDESMNTIANYNHTKYSIGNIYNNSALSRKNSINTQYTPVIIVKEDQSENDKHRAKVCYTSTANYRSEVLETMISNGSENKEDIYLPTMQTQKKRKLITVGNSETDANTRNSNLQSHVDNITTNSNAHSIIEFDAMSCSYLKNSTLNRNDSNKDLNRFKQNKSKFLALNSLPTRKNQL